MYKLERCQTIRTTLENAWDFLKNPKNLNTITPDDLCFQILSDVPETMFDGLLIEYRIKIPVFGTRQWLAEIKHVRECCSFVDEQRVGPYSFWYHYHELNRVEQGIEITDRVYYTVPYGIFGNALNFLFIHKTLERIFDYRQQRIKEIFEK